MPRKIRDIESDLARAGFTCHPGKGSHRHWTHPRVKLPVTISGNSGADADHYQERRVRAAISESRRP